MPMYTLQTTVATIPIGGDGCNTLPAPVLLVIISLWLVCEILIYTNYMGTKFTFASKQTMFIYLERSLSKRKKCEFCCHHPHPPLLLRINQRV